MAFTSGLVRHAVPESVRLDGDALTLLMGLGGQELTCRLPAQILREECRCDDPGVWLAWARSNIKALNAAFEEKLAQPWGLAEGGTVTISASEWPMYRPYKLQAPDGPQA